MFTGTIHSRHNLLRRPVRVRLHLSQIVYCLHSRRHLFVSLHVFEVLQKNVQTNREDPINAKTNYTDILQFDVD